MNMTKRGQKKKTILIIHGTMGNPKGNWFPWLKHEIEKLGHKALTPKFPTPKGQTIKNWIKVLDQVVPAYDNSLILIGHSSASMAILAKLQQLEKPIKAAFLVAPFLGEIGILDYDKANTDFISFPFKWDLIKKRAGKFYIYRSNNDPYVPEKNGRIMAEKLKVKERIILDSGHLNAESGYTKFPRLLKDLKQELGTK